MNYIVKLTTMFLCLLAPFLSSAQAGAYDLNVSEYNYDDINMKYYVDINIRAANVNDSFLIADQNYKLTFNEAAINNPSIALEGVTAGFVTTTYPTTAFYGMHTLAGTVDSILSYNVELEGGDGYPVGEQDWIFIGRVVFDLIDPLQSPNITWKRSFDSPATVVGGKDASVLYPVSSNNYYDLLEFFAIEEWLTAAVDDEDSTRVNTPVATDVAANDINGDFIVDATTITILYPPTNGTVSLVNGKIQYLPGADYLGPDSYIYEICSEGNANVCDEATVSINVFDGVGQYDVQLSLYDLDVANMKAYIDIEVKANSASTVFYLSDQSYRFSFFRAGLSNPQLEEELTISQFIQQVGDYPTASFFSPHTLTGSLDTIVSYNVDLSGGEGYRLAHDAYTKVGRLSFDILDLNECLDLFWHDKSPALFPPTFVGEKTLANAALASADEGDYTALSTCIAFIANDDQGSTRANRSISIDVAANDQGGIDVVDPTTVFVTNPPTNGSVSLQNGKLLYAPDLDFEGTDTYTYRVCGANDPSNCDEATVVITVFEGGGQYDVRFELYEIDTANLTAFIDIEVKAHSESTVFYIGEQIYRFSYFRAAIDNPQIVEELVLSGNIFENGDYPFMAFYDTHDLDGTVDTIVSYNVNMGGGDGYRLPHDQYTKVGRLAFDIVDLDECIRLVWHDEATFPPTFINESIPGNGFPVPTEGDYTNLIACIGNTPPVTLDDNVTILADTPFTFDVLANDTDQPDGGIDPTSVVIVTMPTNGIVTVNPDGTITYDPNPSFIGNDSFEYQACDGEGLCDSAVVYLEIWESTIIVADDQVSTRFNAYVVTDVAANDIGGDTTTLSLINLPANGTASLHNGKIKYFPALDFIGTDSYSYEICAAGNPSVCDEATVTVDVFDGAAQYDVKFEIYEMDCANMKVYVDLSVKAHSESTVFYLSDQNYRFSFGRYGIENPQIEEELEISGFKQQFGDYPTFSLWREHDLNGSIDTVMSYNVALDGGEGYRITHEEYIKVGRISFDILDLDECVKLSWHDHSPALFPPTYVGEKKLGISGTLFPADEGDYTGISACGGLSAQLYLEGALDLNTGLMSTTLNEKGLLPGQTPTVASAIPTPAGQPFNVAPWNYTGTESIIDYDETVVDWVLIGFSEDPTFTGGGPSFLQAGLLHNDGRVEFLSPQDLPVNHPNPLYLYISHLSHISIASPEPVDFSCYAAIDFRIQAAFGTLPGEFGQEELEAGVWAMHAASPEKSLTGDVNGADRIIFSENNGLIQTYSSSDFNLDGNVNALDILFWYRNNGTFSDVSDN